MKSALPVSVAAVLLWAHVPAMAQQATTAARRTSLWRDIQGFNIVLILGENERTEVSTLELPGAARRALTDMREFLPFKHYRVLDSQWTSCCAPDSIRIGVPMSGRLQGIAEGPAVVKATPGGNKRESTLVPRSYAFTLALRESTDGHQLPVTFSLRMEDTGGGGRGSSQAIRIDAARIEDMRSDLEILNVQIAEMQKRVEAGVVRPDELKILQTRQTQLQRRIAEATDGGGSGSSGRGIIDTGFMMVPGETVVVGTSRLGGDRALIALVTAVRRTTGGR
jgi:hypothetical protein